MGRRVNVIGVGMTKFAKPGQSEDYHVMASKAARAALEDAKIPYAAVEQAFAGYVYGDSTCGQRAVYEVGLTGIPVFNVTKPDASWVVDLTGSGGVREGKDDKATTALRIEDAELAALCKAADLAAKAQDLYQHGKLRVDGDVRLAHKLTFLKDLL